MDAGVIEQELQQESAADEPRVAETREPVLLVEDDFDSRETLVELLASWGYEAVPVSSAEEASTPARRRPLPRRRGGRVPAPAATAPR